MNPDELVAVLDRPHRKFTPRQVSGLRLWLDASRISGLADNAAVSQWNDFSGQGNHVAQATGASQPLYRTNILNGRPVVRFDGTDDSLFVDNPVGLAVGGSDVPFSVIAVHISRNASGTKAIWSFANSAGDNPHHVVRANGTTNQLARRDDAGTEKSLTGAAGSAAVNTAYVVSQVFIGSLVSLWANGAVQGSLNTDLDVGTVTFNRFSVGRHMRLTPTTPYNGDIAEVVVYNRALSDVERKRVERYLGRKYGITVA